MSQGNALPHPYYPYPREPFVVAKRVIAMQSPMWPQLDKILRAARERRLQRRLYHETAAATANVMLPDEERLAAYTRLIAMAEQILANVPRPAPPTGSN